MKDIIVNSSPDDAIMVTMILQNTLQSKLKIVITKLHLSFYSI